MVYKG
jgi:hypothetical protein